jgi:hypothetical protein
MPSAKVSLSIQVEKSVKDLLDQVATKEQLSTSAFLRKLIDTALAQASLTPDTVPALTPPVQPVDSAKQAKIENKTPEHPCVHFSDQVLVTGFGGGTCKLASKVCLWPLQVAPQCTQYSPKRASLPRRLQRS